MNRVALAGNPNVGKSTLFNALTGLRQHTGNWAGKTVATARGEYSCGGREYQLIDLPGTYSLAAHSQEEAVARDYIESGQADGVVVVCDATCLERNLILVLQVLELTGKVLVCVNLMDEAKRLGIEVDLPALSRRLGVPVVGTAGARQDGLDDLKEAIARLVGEDAPAAQPERPPGERVTLAERYAAQVVRSQAADRLRRQRRLDRLLTSKATGIPLMMLLLGAVVWLTVAGANLPSALLTELFARLGAVLEGWLSAAPEWLRGLLLDGVYRVTAWVVAVMLPPMAIFFPLFTLLEDLGYLPRVAFVMDHAFQKARTCGKQCLTMCMSLGCNACGVTGCRIIDSPRERLIAILTASLVPCNGKFPTLIALITIFFVGGRAGLLASLEGAALLLGTLALGAAGTLACSRLLSATVLRGAPSSFALELPPFRKPRVGQVIVRSLLDRTLFVLGRAVSVAAPAGALIWVMANVTVGDVSLLARCTGFLDPFARLFGLDGVILMAFLLGWPANEIVLPVMLMAYLAEGSLVEFEDLAALGALLTQHGWTWVTAVCAMLFSLFHWPCSTTCLTIYKETGSVKWTAASVVIPTLLGLGLCFVTAAAARLLGLA
ncbi:MAG: ferrous iron transporter B [Oscillospiraceae bacterium]|jgi:ferrous iron transport protein B|nr:ferrous iron transporter B [Oscillospiraceae bacterium]